jgi:hypothetical protein
VNPPPISVDLPESWRRRTNLAPFAMVAYAHPWPAGFVPNLTLALAPAPPGLALESYLRGQVDAAVRSLTDAVLVDVGVDQASPSATFVIAHATTGVDLTMVQRHVLTDDGWAIAATVTAANADWAVLAGNLLALVRSVRCAT